MKLCSTVQQYGEAMDHWPRWRHCRVSVGEEKESEKTGMMNRAGMRMRVVAMAVASA